jgi:hypothetical protein
LRRVHERAVPGMRRGRADVPGSLCVLPGGRQRPVHRDRPQRGGGGRYARRLQLLLQSRGLPALAGSCVHPDRLFGCRSSRALRLLLRRDGLVRDQRVQLPGVRSVRLRSPVRSVSGWLAAATPWRGGPVLPQQPERTPRVLFASGVDRLAGRSYQLFERRQRVRVFPVLP